MFQLHEGVHHQMDKIRANFFWGSDGTKFKYHMVRWENFLGGWNHKHKEAERSSFVEVDLENI
jgi:hypothetical protein